jgi:hypothetical protein
LKLDTRRHLDQCRAVVGAADQQARFVGAETQREDVGGLLHPAHRLAVG